MPYRRKKLTFAISSSDEFLYNSLYYRTSRDTVKYVAMRIGLLFNVTAPLTLKLSNILVLLLMQENPVSAL